MDLNSIIGRMRQALQDTGVLGTLSPTPNPPDLRIIFNQPTATPTPTPTPIPRVTPMPSQYEKEVMPTFDQYQIPREVAFGIRAAEGGKINGFNIGAVDSNPGNARAFDNILAEATAAAKLFSGQWQNPDGTTNDRYKPAYDLREDPVAMLEKIQNLGYAGDPATWKQRSIDTGGAGQFYDSWAEFVQNTRPWGKWNGQY